MRTTQIMGLNAKALGYLKRHAARAPDIVCPDCGKVIRKKLARIPYLYYEGAYDERSPLYEYRNKKTEEPIREVVQASPWSSGPVIFLCLETRGKLICQWPQKTIDNC
jgi:hypothetical protein